MHGLFIFTRRHYSANIRYQAAAGPVDNANGNAGPYIADGRRIVFTQWVQIHVRPDDAQQPVLSRQGPMKPLITVSRANVSSSPSPPRTGTSCSALKRRISVNVRLSSASSSSCVPSEE